MPSLRQPCRKKQPRRSLVWFAGLNATPMKQLPAIQLIPLGVVRAFSLSILTQINYCGGRPA